MHCVCAPVPFSSRTSPLVPLVSRDEVRRVHVNVLLQFSRGHFIDDASRLFSLHHCMHWSWSAKILHNLKKFIEDIVYLYN